MILDDPLLIHTESSMAWGGQEIRIFTELNGLKNIGWRVGLWAPKSSEIYTRTKAVQIPAEKVPFRRAFDPWSVVSVRRMIRERQPDLVVTHSSIDSWVVGLATRGMAARPKLVRTRHLSTPVRNYLSYRWFPDAICTTSEAIRRQLIAHGIAGSRVVTIPTGVDLSRFRPNPAGKPDARKKYGLPADRPLVGGVFVIRSWKGIYDFVKIAAAVPEANFVVAGDGPSRGTMKQAAVEAGVADRLHFVGHVEPVEEIFRALDVFLFPSTANEGIPQALLQAQACGVPAVASDLASVREAARSARFCAPGDVAGFAREIRHLLADGTGSKQVSDEGTAWVKQFDQSDILKKIDSFYRSVLHAIQH